MLTRRSFILLSAAGTMLIACGPRSSSERTAPTTVPPTRVRVSGSGTVLPAVQKLGEGYETIAPDVRLEFPSGTNAGGGIRGVVDGTLDIAVASRPLTAAEGREPVTYHPFVRDAVVFAVNRSVPIQGLNTAQLRDVYGGTTTNWDSVGGTETPVILLDRDEDDATRKLVLLPFLAGRAVPDGTITLTSAPDMLSALDTTPNALGYTTLGLLRLRAPKNIVPLMLDDVAPSQASMASGAYPWSLTFGLIVRADAPPAVRAFVEHVVRSARGVLGPFDYEAVDG